MPNKKDLQMQIIARIKSDFTDKFGIPRQSGIIPELKARIVFEPPYRNIDALRGLEGFSHIWLLWHFSACENKKWAPTVRPPKLGGNKRVGVFASRSPFRPNRIGLSSVKLERIEYDTPYGPVLHVLGADLMNDTPILDIKPYLAYTDCHPQATGGFSLQELAGSLEIVIEPALLDKIPPALRQNLLDVLKQDPRPGYQHSPERIYGLTFSGFNIRFSVENNILTVLSVTQI